MKVLNILNNASATAKYNYVAFSVHRFGINWWRRIRWWFFAFTLRQKTWRIYTVKNYVGLIRHLWDFSGRGSEIFSETFHVSQRKWAFRSFDRWFHKFSTCHRGKVEEFFWDFTPRRVCLCDEEAAEILYFIPLPVVALLLIFSSLLLLWF